MDIQNINCLAILDKDGSIFIKRDHKPTDISTIYHKIKSEKDEITIIDDLLVVYKNLDNAIIFISAPSNSNDIFIYKALESFYTGLVCILKGNPTKENVMSFYDQVVLLLDCFIYEGIVIEDDADKLVASVATRPFEGLEGMKIPKGFSSIFNKATQSFRK